MITNAADLTTAGATIAYKTAPAAGQGFAVVTVTYADGTVREVTVPVTIADNTTAGETVIVSGTEQKDAQNSINGYVKHNREGNPTLGNTDANVPMEGVTVYAQWMEKDGSVSPIYSGITGADGSFHIVMQPFVTADGTVKNFDADVLLPEGEKFRVWAINPDPTKYDLMYNYQNGQVGPATAIFSTETGASYDLGPNRINDINITFSDDKQPEVMHDLDTAVESPNTERNSDGQVRGAVYWNNYVAAGALDYGTLMSDSGNIDPPAVGIEVIGSYLSDAAIAKIMAEAPAAIGITNIRGDGWTNQNEEDLQSWIKEQMAIDGKDFWIAESVKTVIDANGEYTLQFNGTYGVSWNNVGTFADENANALKGTVADTYTDGRWATSGGDISHVGPTVSKHINKELLFISTERLEGVAQITDWRNNWYKPASGNFQVYTENYTTLNNTRFALQPERVIFDATPYDSFNNFAAPGDEITTNTAGLPNAFASNQQYAIEWTDSKGNVVVSATPAFVATDETIPSVPMTVPADLVGTKTYTAKLYAYDTNGNRSAVPLAVDSFTATSTRQNLNFEPEYATELITPGTPATSTPIITDNDGAETTAPEGTQFAIPEGYVAPDGYTVFIDPITGVVTVTALDSPTLLTVESFEVPVVVTYPDGSVDETVAPFQLDTDGDNTPDMTDTDDDGDGVDDSTEKEDGTNTKDPNSVASTIENIDDQTGTVGEEITPITVVTDKIPTNGSVDVKGLPDSVTYNPETGEITGKPTTEGTYEVTVTVLDKDGNPVTGPDGNPVTETFTFTVMPKPTDAETNEPVGQDVTVPVGEQPNANDTVSNLPELPVGTTVDFKEPVDTSTVGDKEVVVVVTYPDGTTDEVTVTVTVVDTIAPEAPVISDKDGNIIVTPAKDATELIITYVDENGKTQTVVVIKDSNGQWVTDNTVVTVNPETGEVTIPGEAVKADTELTAVNFDEAGNESDTSVATIGNADEEVISPDKETGNVVKEIMKRQHFSVQNL